MSEPSPENPAPVAVVGASGYTGEELLRYLLHHPGVEIACITSRQNAGSVLSDVCPRFRGNPRADELKYVAPSLEGIVGTGAEFAFLALPHGLAHEFAEPLVKAGLRVIDLSADFRLRDKEVFKEYYGDDHPAPHLLDEAVYGLPEIREAEIAKARLVASPGCYPTSVLLPLIPLLREGAIDPDAIFVASMSGVSGAGRKASTHLLFAECNESVKAYGVPKHRHLSEIEQELGLAAGRAVAISFVPHLMPVTAGICTTIFTRPLDGWDGGRLGALYEAAYGDCPFVRLLGTQPPDTRNVVGTNFLDLGWTFDARTGRMVLMSAEDNLGKGAAGQAVQSFNLMRGLPQETGLMRA